MKIFRKPLVNAVIISIISFFYAFIFDVTSGHIEFERILDHRVTSSSPFWNGWSDFLKQGNMKYIGCAYIAIAVIIVILSIIRKRDYDEYQIGILEKGIIVMGATMVLLFPIALISILSDHSYAVEDIMFLVVIHWSIVLISDLMYVIKWSKS